MSTAAYRAAHREGARAYSAAYRTAHREECRAYDAAHREVSAVRHRAWHAAHRDEWRAYKAAWDAAHRAEKAHRTATRKFGEAVALDLWRTIWSGTCFGCGVTPAEGVDHIIPFSKGGRNVADNLQPACLPCNDRKYTKAAHARVGATESHV